jgi:hypothetical protein
MIPKVWVRMEELPRNANGKVVRAKLPDPKQNRENAHYGALDSEVLARLVYTLEDVLNRNVSGDVVVNITGQPVPPTNANGSQFYGTAFNGLFQQCGNMTSLTVNGLKWVPARFMQMDGVGNVQSNPALLSVSMPDALFAGQRAFQGCRKMTTASLPSLRYGYVNYGTQSSYMFVSCAALTTVDIGSLDRIGQYMFQNCTSLMELELKAATYIEANAFNGSSKLANLVIRSSAVPTLANINAFTNTPFASGKAGGTLYVPSSLISSYQSATNWSTILGYATNSIAAIEGSVFE